MTTGTATPLQRRFGLVQATALNMINMIGIGPFITIPLLMTALGGPQAMLGWIVALVIVICDGMVWSELGAAMPQSGGSFGYLREAFGRQGPGRLMAFLFVWQFILSGPLRMNCQTNKNAIKRPKRSRPNASRRYPNDPPGPGIAAPSSLQTMPSQMTITSARSQPSMA